MTKKHFKAIAQAIKETDINTADKHNFIVKLSHTFKQLNPRFDYQRFYDACYTR